MSELYSKEGVVTRRVALELCNVSKGERIPTVSALEARCQASRGNVQKALANLKAMGAISLESHGQNGTTLTDIDHLALAHGCGRDHLVGVMPLPYTTRYEGLATSLFTLLNVGGLRSFITFLRGSEARVQALLDGFANYAVMSRMAYDDYASRGCGIELALECGPLTYVGRHVLLSRDAAAKSLDGARVGIDESSVDQSSLTRRYFANANVEYVPVQYTHIVDLLLAGELDTGIWNEDDVHVRASGLAMRPLDEDGAQDANTRAVVVTRSDDPLTRSLVTDLLSASAIEDVQRRVMSGELMARY
ncbi:MAG TPA: hypothetical protein IAA19_03680 [Candidatus Olsenella pullistercoris]|uniref:Uncharacterized protein n=1 Tax=Candidatus Olsenella pullistercoris TaxID=2838712 RepID=A0A9D2EZF3_9ACTN|nr:hypothetical protein [Candidatus Olsenella pullistercoris]